MTAETTAPAATKKNTYCHRCDYATDADGRPVLSIETTKGRKVTTARYYLSHVPSDFGLCFRLDKLDATQGDTEADHYYVRLDDEQTSCECRGFLQHEHCKHVDSIRELIEEGVL